LPALFCRHEKTHFYKNTKILRLILLDIFGAEFYEEADPQNRILKFLYSCKNASSHGDKIVQARGERFLRSYFDRGPLI
jgi:hypothetical protein